MDVYTKLNSSKMKIYGQKLLRIQNLPKPEQGFCTGNISCMDYNSIIWINDSNNGLFN